MAADAQPKMQPAAHDDRRKDVRYRLEEPGLVADSAGVYDCIVGDISVGGALLEGDLPLESGTEIALGFDSVMGILGEVVHRGEGFIGVRFTGDARQRAMIVAWLRMQLRRQVKATRARARS